jgi:hypothetical protein
MPIQGLHVKHQKRTIDKPKKKYKVNNDDWRHLIQLAASLGTVKRPGGFTFQSKPCYLWWGPNTPTRGDAITDIWYLTARVDQTSVARIAIVVGGAGYSRAAPSLEAHTLTTIRVDPAAAISRRCVT